MGRSRAWTECSRLRVLREQWPGVVLVLAELGAAGGFVDQLPDAGRELVRLGQAREINHARYVGRGAARTAIGNSSICASSFFTRSSRVTTGRCRDDPA